MPEIVNEPVFPHDPAAWAALQHAVLTDIRTALPDVTVVLTGQDWGSVGGLLALTPEADPNVVYSFHFYDPAELTSLAAWLPSADRDAFARLPFPVGDPVRVPGTGRGGGRCAFGPSDRRLLRLALGCRPHSPNRSSAPRHWAHRHGVSLIAGEFGASAALNRPARLAWIARRPFGVRGRGYRLGAVGLRRHHGLRGPPAAVALLRCWTRACSPLWV